MPRPLCAALFKTNAMILVTGAGGTLGRRVLLDMERASIEALAWLRRPDPGLHAKNCGFGDLRTLPELLGPGLRPDRLLHLASSGDAEQEMQVLDAVMKLAAGRQLQHLVYVSILGVNRSSYPYYRLKFRQEQVLSASGLPYTVVRLSQFHEFVLQRILRACPLPAAAAWELPSGLHFQSIDLSDASRFLLQVLGGEPAFGVLERGGPRWLNLEQMVPAYLQRLGKSNEQRYLPLQDPLYEVFRSGINRTEAGLGEGRSWEEFLAGQDPQDLRLRHPEQKQLRR